MPARTGLSLKNITIRLDGHLLLAVDTQVQPGDVLTIMGPSGSGKSTLLAFIGGFLDPAFEADGRLIVDGLDMTTAPAEQRHAGILFQDPLLFPHMSVAGNVAFALPQAARGRAERRLLAEAALADVDLAGYGDRDPATLSGGQKARVALARTLISMPRMLLLDEAFSKLDAALRTHIRTMVFEKAKAAQLPVVLVTHDAADAQAAGGQTIEIGGAAS